MTWTLIAQIISSIGIFMSAYFSYKAKEGIVEVHLATNGMKDELIISTRNAATAAAEMVASATEKRYIAEITSLKEQISHLTHLIDGK